MKTRDPDAVVCERCVFFREFKTDDGECMRNPPTPLYDPAVVVVGLPKFHRPHVKADDWCSHWAVSF
jgi:hypothetical protein